MKMANVLLTCFLPSKAFSSKESSFELFTSLMNDLHWLNKSLEHNPLSLRWCSEAMLFVKKIHCHFLHSFETCKHRATLLKRTSMVDEYMRTTLDLLDYCNLMKSAVSNLDRSRMMIDLTLKKMTDFSFTTATDKMELEKLEIEKSNCLIKFNKCKETYLNKGMSKVKLKTSSDIHVLPPIWSTMSSISLFIFCSIIHPTPINIDKGFDFESRLPDLLSDPVQKLNSTFGEKFQHVQKGKPILQENQIIEDIFATVKAGILSDKDGKLSAVSLGVLKNRSQTLKDAIELFESVINELFEDIIKGRKLMIDLITANNHIINF